MLPSACGRPLELSHQPTVAAAAAAQAAALWGLELANISHVARNIRSVFILQSSVLGTDGHIRCAFCEIISR